MTVTIAGVWEFGWNAPIKELDLWKFLLRKFSVDTFVISPVSGVYYTYVKETHDLDIFLIDQQHLLLFCGSRCAH